MTDVMTLARVAASLLVVLVLVVVSLRLAGPWLQRMSRPRGGRIVIAEIVPLDREHRLALVHVDDRELLVGFGRGGVQRLAWWQQAGGGEGGMGNGEGEAPSTSAGDPTSTPSPQEGIAR